MSSIVHTLLVTDAQMEERADRVTIADPGSNRGYTTVMCPVLRCGAKYRFRETDQTLKEARMTQARRELYLKAAHNAGRH